LWEIQSNFFSDLQCLLFNSYSTGFGSHVRIVPLVLLALTQDSILGQGAVLHGVGGLALVQVVQAVVCLLVVLLVVQHVVAVAGKHKQHGLIYYC